MDNALAIFRTIATEFSNMTDTSVLSFMEVFSVFVGKKVFGKKYDLALAYFTAHMLTLNNMKAAVETTDGAFDVRRFADVKREREGDLEREYAVGDYDSSLLSLTYYGRYYLWILKLCSIGVKTRFM